MNVGEARTNGSDDIATLPGAGFDEDIGEILAKIEFYRHSIPRLGCDGTSCGAFHTSIRSSKRYLKRAGPERTEFGARRDRRVSGNAFRRGLKLDYPGNGGSDAFTDGDRLHDFCQSRR